jgi:hypothetical protein
VPIKNEFVDDEKEKHFRSKQMGVFFLTIN